MTIEVRDYHCESCDIKYSVRYDSEEDNRPEFCPFCAEEVVQEEDIWDDPGVFYLDEEEDEYEN